MCPKITYLLFPLNFHTPAQDLTILFLPLSPACERPLRASFPANTKASAFSKSTLFLSTTPDKILVWATLPFFLRTWIPTSLVLLMPFSLHSPFGPLLLKSSLHPPHYCCLLRAKVHITWSTSFNSLTVKPVGEERPGLWHTGREYLFPLVLQPLFPPSCAAAQWTWQWRVMSLPSIQRPHHNTVGIGEYWIEMLNLVFFAFFLILYFLLPCPPDQFFL